MADLDLPKLAGDRVVRLRKELVTIQVARISPRLADLGWKDRGSELLTHVIELYRQARWFERWVPSLELYLEGGDHHWADAKKAQAGVWEAIREEVRDELAGFKGVRSARVDIPIRSWAVLRATEAATRYEALSSLLGTSRRLDRVVKKARLSDLGERDRMTRFAERKET